MKPFPFGIAPMRPSVRFIFIRTFSWFILFLCCIAGAYLLNPLLVIISWLMLIAFVCHVSLLCAELYIISPEMFMSSTGIIVKTVTWLEPMQIKDFKVRQTKLMHCLNISHVTIISVDDLKVQFTFTGVDNTVLKKALGQILELLKARKDYIDSLFDQAAPVLSKTESHEK